MKKIIYIMGKSASGKDTIYQWLKNDKKFDFHTVVIYTTRPIRSGERDGVDYYFVDEKQVEEFEKAGKIIELRSYRTIHGIWKYMTILDTQFETKKNILMIGTLESFGKIVEYFGKECVIPVYLTLDDGLRLDRALKRERGQESPKYAEMCRRFLADEQDFSAEKLEKNGITKSFVNENLDQCLCKIEEYILQKLN